MASRAAGQGGQGLSLLYDSLPDVPSGIVGASDNMILSPSVLSNGDDVIARSVELLVKGLVGVGVYIASLLALWRLSGVPDVPEKHTIAAVRQRWRPRESW